MNAPVAMRSTALASLAVLALAGAAAASRGPVLRVARPNRVYHLAKPVTGASRVPIGDTYGGATSAGDPLVVQTTPKGKAIARIVDQWFASCTSGKTLPFASALPAASKQAPTVDAHGRFDAAVQGSADLGTATGNVTEEVKGRLGQRRSTGALAAHADVFDKQSQQKIDDCNVSVTWHFGRQDLVYGGATDQQAPVVLQLSKSRQKVASFLIGWGANCSNGGVVYGPLTGAFGSFPLSRRHAFGSRFTETLPTATGGRGKFDYDVKGKVGNSRATGTFAMGLNQTDAFGGTVATCSVAKEHWSATG